MTVRYPLVTPGHERVIPAAGTLPAAGWGLAAVGSWSQHVIQISPTFMTLMARAGDEARAQSGGRLPPAFKNQQSRLRSACAVLGQPLDGPASALIDEAALDAAIDILRKHHGPATRACHDAVSSLRFWYRTMHRLFPGVGEHRSSKPNRLVKQSSLKTMLRGAIKRSRRSQRAVAKAAGVPLSSLERWLRGRLPDERSIEALRKLAQELKIDEAMLLSCISSRHTTRAIKRTTEYGERLAKQRRDRYLISDAAISPQLRAQWLSFFRAQVGEPDPSEPRPSPLGWCIHQETAERHRKHWFANLPRGYVPTAETYWRRVHSYVSWLANVGPSVVHGSGGTDGTVPFNAVPLSLDSAQSLAWLAVRPMLVEYTAWHQARAGAFNNGCKNLLAFARALCGRNTGWLRRRPELAETLPVEHRPANWDTACDAVVEYCSRLTTKDRSGLVSTLERSRNPFAGHLSWYLEFEDPMDPIVKAISTLRLEASAMPMDSLSRAVRLRDAALLSLLLMLPVRLTTASKLRWGVHIKLQGERLVVHIPSALLKNRRTMGALHTQLEGPLVAVVLQYIAEARTTLLMGRASHYMFLSGRLGQTGPWSGLSNRCVDVTQRLCDGYALCEHEFRHLVATKHLRLHPGDYVGVASLLWDTLETVISTYAPKDPTGAIARNAASVNLNPTMRRRAGGQG